MPESKQEQRDEQRRLFQESIVCQQRGHERGATRVDERGRNRPVIYQMGETCPHCGDEVGDPLLERVTAIDRPRMCEERGGHEVAPPTWPPVGKFTASRRPPSLNARCRRCRCNVICYDPIQEGVKVYAPDWSRQIAGEGAGIKRETVKA